MKLNMLKQEQNKRKYIMIKRENVSETAKVSARERQNYEKEKVEK